MDSESTLRSVQQPQHQVVIPFEVGQVLDGRFQILSLLGTGGMGAVFRVKHLLLNMELALKTLDPQRVGDATSVRRFQTEAKAAFALNHPNLVKVHDFGLLEDGHPFLVMDLVRGKTLQQWIKESRRLSLNEIADIFPQICFGLAHAHRQQVVHRDMKPANIMIVDAVPLSMEGSVKILDFGIAKIISGDRGEMQTLTQTGEVFGSPYYMSPEQCSGEAIDQRSDIYSVGCVLFEALTGTPPLVGNNALRTMMQHLNDPAPSLREAALGAEFSEDIESIVAKMLAKSPADRYGDIGIVAHELVIACGGNENQSDETVLQPTAGLQRTVSRPKRARTVTFSRLQLALLMLGTASVTSIFTHLVTHSAKPVVVVPGTDDQLVSSVLSNEKAEGVETTRKLLFEGIGRIEPIHLRGGFQKIVFPSLSLGELKYWVHGKFATLQAKKTVIISDGKPGLHIQAKEKPYLLSNPDIFDRIAPDLFSALEYAGIEEDHAIAALIPGILKQQEQALLHILTLAAHWQSIRLLGLMNVSLTPSQLNALDSINIDQLSLIKVKVPKNGWQGREIFNRIAILELSNLDADPILQELSHSIALTSLSIKDAHVSKEALEGLHKCTSLKELTVGSGNDYKIAPSVIASAAALSQLELLNLRREDISSDLLERLKKNWIQFASGYDSVKVSMKRR